MLFAAFVASVLALLISVACAARVARLSKDCATVLSRASTTSLRAELDEIRDAFEKNSALLKRINQRTVMQERRAAGSGSEATDSMGAAASKDELRRALVASGRLQAGKPAKH